MASFSPAPWRRQPNPEGTVSILDATGSLVAVVHNGDSAAIVEVPALISIAHEARAVLERVEATNG